jgi:hypothetical protein
MGAEHTDNPEYNLNSESSEPLADSLLSQYRTQYVYYFGNGKSVTQGIKSMPELVDKVAQQYPDAQSTLAPALDYIDKHSKSSNLSIVLPRLIEGLEIPTEQLPLVLSQVEGVPLPEILAVQQTRVRVGLNAAIGTKTVNSIRMQSTEVTNPAEILLDREASEREGVIVPEAQLLLAAKIIRTPDLELEGIIAGLHKEVRVSLYDQLAWLGTIAGVELAQRANLVGADLSGHFETIGAALYELAKDSLRPDPAELEKDITLAWPYPYRNHGFRGEGLHWFDADHNLNYPHPEFWGVIIDNHRRFLKEIPSLVPRGYAVSQEQILLAFIGPLGELAALEQAAASGNFGLPEKPGPSNHPWSGLYELAYYSMACYDLTDGIELIRRLAEFGREVAAIFDAYPSRSLDKRESTVSYQEQQAVSKQTDNPDYGKISRQLARIRRESIEYNQKRSKAAVDEDEDEI